MITSICVVSHRLRIEWGNGRWQEADISVNIEKGKPVVVAKPYSLIAANFEVSRYEALIAGDPDTDVYMVIARAIFEYMTTGRHMPMNGVAVLTEGPIQGVGVTADFAAILSNLVNSSLTVEASRL
jgi:hypothetical protein